MSSKATSMAGLALNGIVACFALLIVNAFGLDLLRMPVTPPLPVLLTGMEIAAASLVVRSRQRLETDWQETIGLAGAVIGVFLFFLLPSLPTLYPPTGGVDAAHHYLLANYIAGHQALPHDIVALSPYLGEMTVYPPGPALIVAMLSQAVGQSPLVVMHPFIALVRGLTAGYVFLIAYRLLVGARLRLLAALLAPLLLFVPATYFVGALFGEQYYFAQVVAELLIVAMLARLDAQPSARDTAFVTVLTLALVLSYPAWLPAALLIGAILLARPGVSRRQRVERGLLFAIPLAVLLALFLPGRMAQGGSVLRWEGGTTSPGVAVLGWPLLVLAALGLALAVRRREQCWPVLLTLAVCLAQGAAMLFLSDIVHIAARYHVYKSLHLLIYPLAALGALAATGPDSIMRGRVLWLARSAAIVGAILLAVIALRTTPHVAPVQALDRDMVAAAGWARANVDVTQVGYRTEHGVASYWLHVAILGNKRESFIADSFIDLLPMTVEEWQYGGTWPTYFIADAGDIPQGVAAIELHRQGNVVVLARQPVTPVRVAIQERADAIVGGMIHVAGFSTPTTHITPGQPFQFDLHWYVERWPHSPTPLYLYAHLVDDSGKAWGKVDRQPLDGRFNNQRWPVGVVNTDRFTIPTPADAPPGRYRVQIGLYPADTTRDLPIVAMDGPPIERLLLGPFKVALPTATAQPRQTTNITFGERIQLLGYDLDAATARPGGAVSLRLYWQATSTISEDYTIFVHLVGGDGKPLAQCDAPPREGTYPTSIWDAGEVVTHDCRLELPPDIPAGDYSLRAGLYTWPSLQRLPTAAGDSANLGPITVRAD